MPRTTILFDNPILVKHFRARLRRQHLLPAIAVILIVCACLTYSIFANATASWSTMRDICRSALILLLIVQGFLVMVVGAAQVGQSIVQARESGMLDFHRTSPQSPAALALGFLLGGPVREYILFACTIPAAYLIAYFGDFSLLQLTAVLVSMLVAGMFYGLIGLLTGLSFAKPRGAGALAAIAAIILHILWMCAAATYLSSMPSIEALLVSPQGTPPLQFSFFGITISGFLVSLCHQIPLILFLFVAVCRKIRHERAYPLAKPSTILLFLVVTALAFCDAMAFRSDEYDFSTQTASRIMIYVLLLVGFFLVTAVSPSLSDYIKGKRHAVRMACPTLSPLNDFAPNWLPLVLYTLILFLVGLAATSPLMNDGPTRSTLPAVIGACALLAFGALKQSFDLLFRKHGAVYLALLLFVCWILPLLLSMLAAMSGHEGQSFLFAVMSPLFGIGMAPLEPPPINESLANACALWPTVSVAALSIPLYLIALYRAAKAAEQHDLLVIWTATPIG